MKSNFTVFVLLFLFVSCSGDESCNESKNKHLTYQNIVILSDLSSRVDNKPQKDTAEIHKIIQYFKYECVKPGEKIGDKSCISFSTFSEKVSASIDIDKIKNLGEKQQFINSTGKFINSGLNYQIEQFEQKIKHTYANTRNRGLDLLSILIEKIENEPIVKKDTFLTDGIDTTFLNFENQFYIFTDGYLEYLNKEQNKQFYFGDAEIKRVREYINTNNVDIAKALENNSALSLPPYKNSKNKYINLNILEAHERDKNDILQTYNNQTGQRDSEILEAVWRKWAKESGFKNLSWKKY
jgi:hypothetical protein